MHAEARRLLDGLDLVGLVADPAIGVGIDVEEVARWNDPSGTLFTDIEHAHCRRVARPAESYAGRWCAKEAVLKALSPFLTVSLRDIEIGAEHNGMPVARLLAPAGDGWDGLLRVSIAHSPTVAVAVAVARR